MLRARLLPALALVAAACSGESSPSADADTARLDDGGADIATFVPSDADDTTPEPDLPDARDGSGADAEVTVLCQACERDADCGAGSAWCVELLDGRACVPACDRGTCRPGAYCGTWLRSVGPVDVCYPDGDACHPCPAGTERNACGGCEPLDALPNDPCGTCDSGTWTCDGPGAVVCEGDRGGLARNDCGGCAVLGERIGSACGSCDDGRVVCDGADATRCDGASGDADGDTVCDSLDRCPGADDRVDADGDRNPDACDPCPGDPRDDSDGDGSCDSDDICDGGDDRLDDDRDTVPDDCDRCIEFDDRHDADGDGVPDDCDCDATVCPEGAVCVAAVTGATCPCLRGWEPVAEGCAEIDECERGTDTCHAAAVCTNTPGSYTCRCPDGYDGDGRACTDIDECARRTDDCHPMATCDNTPGGYTCTCRLGYSGDGRTCALITSHTVAFPSSTDTLDNADEGGLITTSGDTYRGSRVLPIGTISAVSTVMPVLDANNLYVDLPAGCYGSATFDVRIDGVLFGTLSIARDGSRVFTPPPTTPAPVTGPEFDFELVTRTVLCGSLDLSETRTTITVVP